MAEKLITHDGKTLSITQWANSVGMKPVTLTARLLNGVPFERAINPKTMRKPASGKHYKTKGIGNQKAKRVHVLVVESALGKPIPKGAVIHHVDGDINNNLPDNLVLCPSHAYHFLLHTRTRALEESGDANKRKCVHCHEYDSVDNLQPHGNRSQPNENGGMAHRECYNKRMREYKQNRRATNRSL